MDNRNVAAGPPAGGDILIRNICPDDMSDMMPIAVEVFAYMVARALNRLEGPLQESEIQHDLGIHELMLAEALEELRDHGYIQVRPRGMGGTPAS
jgi:DNA-binding IscR family transcriptional regulator